MKVYKFIMRTPSATICAILTHVHIENGVLHAIKIGKLGNSKNGKTQYQECEPKEFIAGGGPYIMEECHFPVELDSSYYMEDLFSLESY